MQQLAFEHMTPPSVLNRTGGFEAAIEHYLPVTGLDENSADVHGELARLNLSLGNLEQAASHYRVAFEKNPVDPRNLHGLARLDIRSITAGMLLLVEHLLAQPRLSMQDRSSFNFTLAYIYDHIGAHEKAFDRYQAANIAR